MFTSPHLANPNIKSIINTIITIRFRFQLKEILKYNFACTSNFSIRVKIESP